MNLLVLDATTKTIEAVLSGAPATTQPDFSVFWGDANATGFTEGAGNGVLNGVTSVSICQAPGASVRRVIREAVIYNKDTANVNLTVSLKNTAGITTVLWSGTLVPGGSWRLSDGGVTPGIDGMRYSNPFVRVSCVSGVPEVLTELTAQTHLFAMPDGGGNTYPQWRGSNFTAQSFVEQDLVLNAAHLQDSIYDGYLWLDGTTQRFVSGVAWTSATSRGTGAGSAEQEKVDGVDVNKYSMTVRNGANTYTMPARCGTRVCTFQPTANGQVTWTKTIKTICNKYNKKKASVVVFPGYIDNLAVNSFTLSSTTPIEANGTGNGRVKFILGDVQCIIAKSFAQVSGGTGDYVIMSIGFDTLLNKSREVWPPQAIFASISLEDNNDGIPLSIGSHFVALLFYTNAGVTGSVYSDMTTGSGATRRGGTIDAKLTGLNVELEM